MTGFNFCHDRLLSALWRVFLSSVLLLLLTGSANAIDGFRSMDQYMRRQWGAEQELLGHVNALAQTPDGYLWVGTDESLFRFNGERFLAIEPPAGTLAPINHVLSLTVDDGGVLWISTTDARLLRYFDGKFTLIMSPNQGDPAVTSLARSQSNGLIATGIWHGLMQISPSGNIKSSPITSNYLFTAIAQTLDGRIWLGTREAGLLTWGNGVLKSTAQKIPNGKIDCLLPTKEGLLWIGTDDGLALWDGQNVVVKPLGRDMKHLQILSIIEDRDGNLWLGTSRGLLRYNASGAQWMPRETPDLNTAVTALMEDREGNIWFGSGQHLEQVQGGPIITYDRPNSPEGDKFGAVYVDAKGSVWFAPLAGGLYWMSDGVTHRVADAGLDRDIVYSIDGFLDDIWVGRQEGGLTRLHSVGNGFQAKTWTHKEGLAQDSIYSVRTDRVGGVWAGSLTGGVSHVMDDRVETLGRANGLLSETVWAIEMDRAGTMWFGTPNGLAGLHGKVQQNLSSEHLTNDAVLSLLADDVGGLWIGTTSGLRFENGGHVKQIQLPQLSGIPILGIAMSREALLWIITPQNIFSMSRTKLLDGTLQSASIRSYGVDDGLDSSEGVQRSRSAVADNFGRVWVATKRGLCVASPNVREPSSLAIPQIESLLLDGKSTSLNIGTKVAAGTQRIALTYAGLYLRDPEGIRFRYKLDHFDKDWSEPVSGKTIAYTNLEPGNYRFRVMAANSRGEWNPEESTFAFTVTPFLWQRWQFQLLCAALASLTGVGLYRNRVRTMIAQANMRFEERLIERNRIARDLHDTLLQGLLSATLYLHVTSEQLPPESTVRSSMQRVLGVIERLSEDARDAVKGLRALDSEGSTVEHVLRELAAEVNHRDDVRFTLLTEGQVRPLRPAVNEEVCYIGREAVLNALKHARATEVMVRLEYRPDRLHIAISDDGIGMDPLVVSHGREGHWGLKGMRERGERMGGIVQIVSAPGHGTQIDLNLPAKIAFTDSKDAINIGRS